ncbi:Protein of unknown function [Tistlia consotensis]|uniref:DUF3253 domain-containing protein n=1 Tax=Tistlia consotensis USBA 355 TaxID=560819 RepID=A0A1Y6CNQ1_9PROT|nr:DUF3253 domain-containing protein [Tistlia consotensis]SMF78878.1 Protein of unknown function [Tistlia consotensis USBA 355]SNS15024.1 Protein of unknown function [Tistlia consotensis]
MSENAPDKPADKLDPVAETILALLQEAGPGASIAPDAVARAFWRPRAKPSDPADGWRRYMNAVNQQARHLARAGRIEILRKGEPVEDPHAPIKGVIRLRLPQG